MVAAKPDLPPIALDEFSSQLNKLGPFEARAHIAVALSGGIDSFALTLLAHEWVKMQGGTLTALTVDHGLRSDSKQEALQVHDMCLALGIEHRILPWQPPPDLSSIQHSARDARYGLLSDYCKRHHILHLLTAHHREDQVETFFFRLARGSGLSGLASMAAISNKHSVRLLRPLLSFPKERLLATLKQYNQEWLEDPTNQKTYYTRNHIRKMLCESPESESISSRSVALASQFGEFRNLLNINTASYLTKSISIYPEGYATLKKDDLSHLSEELVADLISQLCVTLGGAVYAPRTEKIQRLCAELLNKPVAAKRSLGGLLFQFSPKQNHWVVYREAKATEGDLELTDSCTKIWDNRFRVGFQGVHEPLMLRALGSDGLSWLKSHEGQKIALKQPIKPKMVLASLPSFWHLEKMIAIPHMNYVNNDYKHAKFTAEFYPAKALAGHAFLGMNVLETDFVKDS